MEKEKEILMSYLAGALDGDGSFSLCKSVRRNQAIHYPIIQIGNLSKELIELFFTTFGGQKTIKKAHLSKDGKNRREFFVWRVANQIKCKPVLESILPYMIGKKDRAGTLLQYINDNPSMSGGKKLTSEILERRERVYYKMRELNLFDPTLQKISNKTVKENSKEVTFWSWVAGLFDTDGCFTIGSRKDRYFDGRAELHMVDLRYSDYIMKNFQGATIGIKKDPSSRKGFLYRLQIKRQDSLKVFLENICPYLLMKKNQCKLLLKFMNEKISYTHSKPNMPEKEINFRRQCKDEMMRLNRL